MRVTAQKFSHIGQLEENQDRVAVLTSTSGESSLLVVADGLGGHSGAALAAQTAVDTASSLWAKSRSCSNPEEFLRQLVYEAHAAINKAGVATGTDPRTTLAALLVSGSQAVSVHAGDSRVMQLSPNGLVKQTLDHSVGRLNVLSGAISEQELATHPDQKKLYSHLGGEQSPEFAISQWNVRAGCRFVVCSDGFWEIFPVPEIQALFGAAHPLQELRARFREKLAALKGHDNTTAILAKVDPGPRPLWYFVLLGLLTIAGLGTALWPTGSTDPGQAPVETPSAATGPAAALRESSFGRLGQNHYQAVGLSVPHAFAAQVTGDERDQAATEGSVAADGIPNQRVNIRPDVELEAGQSTLDAVEQELRRSKMLGAHDALQQKGDSRTLANVDNARFQQMHQGIPVFAAEVVVTSDGRRIVSILGHTAPAIDIETTPRNDYQETIEIARKTMQSTLQSAGEGSLVILAHEDSHRLGWLGFVLIDEIQQRVILDAETGEILYSEPAAIG